MAGVSDVSLSRFADRVELALKLVQIGAILVGGYWTYNKWIRVEQPAEAWSAYQTRLAGDVLGTLTACVAEETRLGAADGVAFISMHIETRNEGAVPLGIDSIEISIDTLAADMVLGKRRFAAIAPTDYPMLVDTIITADNSDSDAPLGVVGPKDRMEGAIQFLMRPQKGVYYRFHAQARLKSVVFDKAGAPVVSSAKSPGQPRQTWAMWTPGTNEHCS